MSDSLNLYNPRERNLYSYWNGEFVRSFLFFRKRKIVKADPVELWKRVMEVGPEMANDVAAATSPSKFAVKAHNDLDANIRNIFGIKSFAEGGLTQVQVAGLLDHFLQFCNSIKKNSPASASNWETIPLPDFVPTSGVDPAMPNMSESGSTVEQQPIENQPSSASVSA